MLIKLKDISTSTSTFSTVTVDTINSTLTGYVVCVQSDGREYTVAFNYDAVKGFVDYDPIVATALYQFVGKMYADGRWVIAP